MAAKMLQEEPYVKVATREIAILVQEVQNSQKEKRDLKERCMNLETYISNMRPKTIRQGNESRVNSNQSVTRSVFFPDVFPYYVEPFSKPEEKLIEAKTLKSLNQLENDLEEDSVSVTEEFAETDSALLTGRQIGTAQSNIVFKYPQMSETSTSDNDFEHDPVTLPKYTEENASKKKFYGVSEDSFNMALKELTKCKKSNAELKKMTETAPKNLSELYSLEEKVRQVEVENAALHSKIKGLESNVKGEAPIDIVNTLQKKIFQQERKSSLNNLAFDQLNKQCEKWRRKYEEMSNQFRQLSQQIYSQQYEVVRDAPIFEDEQLEISTPGSTPNFDQLLQRSQSLETDVVMYDQENVDSLNQNKSENRERVRENNADINMFGKNVNTNFSDENKHDILDNSSDLDNAQDNQTTYSSTFDVFLRNLNARNDVSTQMDSSVFGRNKYVQTDDNNNEVIDEQTQTEQTIVTCDVRDNVTATDMILDSTTQNDLLNERYECMTGENTLLKSGLDEKDNSVAKELANSMKQLNLQLFSVYKDKDSLKKMVRSQYEDFRRDSPGRGVYSMPSTISDTKPRQTIQLNSSQITVLSDLSAADFTNLDNVSDQFPREYRSCPEF